MTPAYYYFEDLDLRHLKLISWYFILLFAVLCSAMALQMRAQQGTLAHSRVRDARFVPFTAKGPVTRCNLVNVAQPHCCSHRQFMLSTAAPQQQRAAVAARASATGNNNTEQLSLPDGSVSVVLLAGGVGKRMGASIPKQYLELKGRPLLPTPC